MFLSVSPVATLGRSLTSDKPDGRIFANAGEHCVALSEKAGFTFCGLFDEPEGRMAWYVRDIQVLVRGLPRRYCSALASLMESLHIGSTADPAQSGTPREIVDTRS